MSKVFNKIRYALLSDNKTGKYLKYAIGEIILVVIGILIALQINTWNEERKTAIEEGLYLNRLLAENKEDLESFSIEIKNLEKGIETILTFSEAFKTLNTPDTLLVKAANGYFQFGSIYPTFTSSTSTFDDLSSTGNLKVISNSSLRDKLVKHYAFHKQTAERIRIGIGWALPVDGAFTYEHSIMRFEPSSTFLFPHSSMEDLALDLKNNRFDFINVAAAQYWLKNDAITQLKGLSSETKDVIELLENEIAK
ncbi:hypothetical protein J4050_10435 [Winogradskyella sp. DF17]|uniref:CHASE domain-containing protein n=1 Tax=Winogradskyella pelagia TaxID=2819984 RepID=A0ABS3T348_9FLAO|nr:DUF6090 family protein [Winogradskyella sp. DF17]MBO3117166.1 hypothetical protein [Winogradskyella sp. DF17]